ncbi:MAG TPA: MAPEG family protein [Gammaproteobacteria bacterium]|nr:MAPEG family protein [Gammaproteobacteria bacterium]
MPVNAETLVFLLTILLGFAQILILVVLANSVYGLGPLVGPRDNLQPSDNKWLGRMRRANENFKETLPWALGLLIMVQITGHSSATTVAGAWLYFWARVAYVPLYLFGIPWLRTLAWTASIIGLGMLLVPIFG